MCRLLATVRITIWWSFAAPTSQMRPMDPWPRPRTSPARTASSCALGQGEVVEPDNYPVGTVLTSVVPGITLTEQGGWYYGYAVTSQTGQYASTGTRVFGWGDNTEWYEGDTYLEADLQNPSSSVSIDVGADNPWGQGIMWAYDSSWNFLGTVVSPQQAVGTFTTLTFSAPFNDIAHIYVTGTDGSVLLDHLVVGGGNSSGDFYKVAANAGQTLAFSTSTPSGGSGGFVNNLAPQLELYDPNGNVVASGTVGADGRNEVLQYVATVAGDYTVNIAAQDQTAGEYFLNELTPLTVTVPANMTEGDGTETGSISIPQPLNSNLTVSLVSSDPSRITLPSSEVIPAGQTSVSVPVTVIDDSLLNGPETVSVTASAPGCLNGVGTIHVHDNETATLTMTLPSTANELGVSVTGTLTCSAVTRHRGPVDLQRSAQIAVPETVILPAGQTSVDFTATLLDDHIMESGPNPVALTASVENWTSGSATINVLDGDHTMTVMLPTSGWEGNA